MTKNNILVVVAHPDDETIGLGGTMKRHIEEGANIFVVSMTNGVGSRENISSLDIYKRKEASKKASDLLGFKWEESFSLKDNQLDTYPLLDIVKFVEKIKRKIKPLLVYTHCGGDLNIDHRVVSNAVLTAFRPQPDEIYTEIRLFEVASATDYGHKDITGVFEPNLFVDISATWGSKFSALEAYKSELFEAPHSRSLEGLKNLARFRGNQVGIKMAEAFQIIRKIER